MEMTVERVNNFDSYNWLPLLAKSSQEGFQFIEHMLRNRRDETFQETGEALFIVLSPMGQPIACGGYTKQPHEASTGRIRHVYVLPEARSKGVGTSLLEKMIREAFLSYDRLVLFSDAADGFYRRLGFVPASGEKVTHELVKSNNRKQI